MLEEGKKIPKFSLADQSSEEKSFNDLVGEKGLILYAYPKDNTPGCTKEANEFNELRQEFLDLGYNVVGMSKDSVKSHCNFVDKYGLEFPLLSDPEFKLMEPLGAYGEKVHCGKTIQGVIRSTFIFDTKGKLTKAYRNVKAAGHAGRVLKDLKG